jgi:hypothetical protein
MLWLLLFLLFYSTRMAGGTVTLANQAGFDASPAKSGAFFLPGRKTSFEIDNGPDSSSFPPGARKNKRVILI